MPYIANRSQQMIARAWRPMSAYSRVVSITVNAAADGTVGYNATPPVGNTVWLWHVKIKVMPKAINAAQGTLFNVYAGQGKPRDEASLVNWQNVLPLYDPNDVSIGWFLPDGRDEIEWDMMRLYKGENRRFGIRVRRLGGVMTDGLWASFTISEG